MTHPHIQFTESLGFHLSNHLFFKRMRNGAVQITKCDENDVNNVLFKIICHSNEWASVVSSVSINSETSDTWKDALRFHMVEKS